MNAMRLAAILSSGKRFAPPLAGTAFSSTLVIPTLSFVAGSAVSATTPVVFANGVPAYTITVSPLIPGLTVRSTDGQINAGTAGSTSSGVYRFSGVDSLGTPTFKDVTINIGVAPVFTAAIPPAGTVGTPYSYQFTATGAVSYALASGTLPAGLTISSSGLLSGTPSSAATFIFVISATNAFGTTNTVTKTVDIAAGSGGGVSPLSALTPVNVEAGGYDQSYNEETISRTTVTNDGIVRVQPQASILGAGKKGYLKRMRQPDPISSGSGHRAEFSGSGVSGWTMAFGQRYMFAFSINFLTGEIQGTSETGTSDMVFFQIHQDNILATPGPTFAIGIKANRKLFVSRVWGNTANGTAINGVEEYPLASLGVVDGPTAGGWTRYTVEIQLGYQADQNPMIKVRQNEIAIIDLSYAVNGSAAFIGQQTQGHYAKIGFYKWHYGVSDYGVNQSRAAGYSDLYAGVGTGLTARADESNRGFGIA